jgi:hypothetical protein
VAGSTVIVEDNMKKSLRVNVDKRIAQEEGADPKQETDTQRIRGLIGRALDDEDWLRIIRRLARSTSIRASELLMNYQFGLPVNAVQTPPHDGIQFIIPPIEE